MSNDMVLLVSKWFLYKTASDSPTDPSDDQTGVIRGWGEQSVRQQEQEKAIELLSWLEKEITLKASGLL